MLAVNKLFSIKDKLEIRHQTKVILHNDHTSCNFFITVSYVVHTVKNNSGSCDTLSNDQSVNYILSSLHAHDKYESKYVYYTKHIF